MDKNQAIKLVEQYKAELKKLLPINEVYIYGSYSKGTQTAESDIDVAVVVDKLSENYFEDTPLLWKVRRQISNLIEPVLLTSDLNNPLYYDIKINGLLIK